MIPGLLALSHATPPICPAPVHYTPRLFVPRPSRDALCTSVTSVCNGCDRAEARDVSASAIAKQASEQTAWYKEYPHLWTEIETDEQFWQAVNDDAFDVVLVDWYAPWCKGCKRSFPELSKLASSESLSGRVKFVKVCIDNLKSIAKQHNVKVLPQVGLFRPRHGLLFAFQAVPSKLRVARSNIGIVLDNPGKFFKLDPNGCVLVLDDDPTPELSKAKEQAKKLAASTGSLFDHLMATANGSSTKLPPAPSPPAPASNGNGAADASPEAPASSLAAAKAEFLDSWRDQYGYKGRIDELYANEVGCRLKPHEHYLDYTGSALYCRSALEATFADLQSNVFGNPHSANPSSSLTGERIEHARDRLLRFFNADPSEYHVVFTKSATGALKITGETFPWTDGSVFRYTRENHNSVLGMREYALAHSARFQAVEEEWVEDWLSGHKEGIKFVHPKPGNASEPVASLFAFPAEENFSGKKYPLRWIREIQAMSTPGHQWKVLLDAAAFVPTQPLDLSLFPADFVTISFYKMFGYPTGLGALLVRTENIDMMKKVFWGGGTVAVATSSDNFHVLKCRPSDKLEDGTLPFLDIIALQHSFDFLESLGGIEAIQSHVHALTRHAVQRLEGLRHSNGARVVVVFGNHSHPAPELVQGGIVNFEVLDPQGQVVSYRLVEEEAAQAGFHVRTGIHCNPGAAYRDVGVTEAEVESLAGIKEGCGDDVDFIDVQRPLASPSNGGDFDRGIVSDADLLPMLDGGATQLGHPSEIGMRWVKKPLGSVRVSLGYMSTFEDVELFCRYVADTYADRVAPAL